jgi:hypothetical protein
MRSLLWVAMLFASTPAVAEPAPRIASAYEQYVADQKAMQTKMQTKIYGESSGIGFTFSSAFIRGATLGISEIVLRQFGDEDFPVFEEAAKVNPRASALGTLLGGLVLAGLVYGALMPIVWRRRIARDAARKPVRRAVRAIPAVERPEGDAGPDGLEDVVGFFVTRDGYEFVVMRQSHNPDHTFN